MLFAKQLHDRIKRGEVTMADVTPRLARRSGFASVEELLGIAKHGRGESVYLVEFHYIPGPGPAPPPRSRGRRSR